MKAELSEKDSQITQLKRNVKVSKHREVDNETQVYAEECQRLRTMLE